MPRRSGNLLKSHTEYKTKVGRKIGARINQRRTELNFSQEVLRSKLELENVLITRSRLSRLENGETLPDAVEVLALTKVLRVSLGWLIDTDKST